MSRVECVTGGNLSKSEQGPLHCTGYLRIQAFEKQPSPKFIAKSQAGHQACSNSSTGDAETSQFSPLARAGGAGGGWGLPPQTESEPPLVCD